MAKIDIAKLIEGLAFENDEQKALIEKLFSSEKNQEALSEKYMMRSDYSKAQDETKAAKAAAEAAQRAAAEKEAANKAWFDSLKKYEDQAKADAEKNAAYEKYLADMGLEPAAVLTGSGVQPPARKAAEPTMDTKFLEENKQFQAQTAATAQLLANLPFELQAVTNEHFRLFGTVPPVEVLNGLRDKFLDQHNTKPLMDIATAELHFGDRRKQLDEEALQRRTDELVNEKIQKWESEHKLPTGALSAAETEPAVNMTSEKFASEVKRSSENDINRVSERDLAAFAAVEQDLAGVGIRMTQ
jgi:hypothetical protein